jgi:hypothetical protein
VREIVGGLSRILIDIYDPVSDMAGTCVAIGYIKAGIDAVIETIVIGPVSNDS